MGATTRKPLPMMEASGVTVARQARFLRGGRLNSRPAVVRAINGSNQLMGLSP